MVEDTHTSYWRGFGGDSDGSFMEFVKGKLDALHYFRLPEGSAARARLADEDVAFARRTKSVAVFESVVVFETWSTEATASHFAPTIRGSVFTPGVGQRADSRVGIGRGLVTEDVSDVRFLS